MTTDTFAALVGPTAKALNTAYQLAIAGKTEGTFPCPKCGSTLHYKAAVPHQPAVRCSAAGCIRYA